METVGIVGLGVMGSAMAGHLLDAGFTVVGYDVDPEKAGVLADRGGRSASSSAEVAEQASLILLSLASVAALEDVTAGLVDGAHPEMLVLEMGTFPLVAKEAARERLSEVGVELMDVPVSGTGLQAADATLVVLASGSEEGYRRALPVFEVVGRSSYHLGGFGTGSVMKYIANLLVAVHNLATAEAHALGIAAGLEPALVQRVMSDGVGGSKIFDIRGPMMVADQYEPPAARLDIILKDAGIIAEFARSVGAPTPLLDAALPVYEASKEEGLGELDAAALCRHLERLSGLNRLPENQR
ncbi:MAG TPA: NAD(P)-dependent oxidoreductase [Acidimicrobiia bacterium]|nr:NAD(P)-dependent oxidoreductase [Acidimicrobiia bacterium]